MAKYPPTTGENWALNGQRYRIVGIDPQTKDVLVENGLKVAGFNPERNLVEIVELEDQEYY